MKGIVFTEFLEMVEDRFGPDVADRIIVEAGVRSGGAYTSVGSYDHAELVALVVRLAAATGLAPDALVRAFGHHLFGRFVKLYPQFFVGVGSAFEFLRNVEHYIHPEVRKLYPDAELPHFESRVIDAGRMDLVYRSTRSFADLAEGLIRGVRDHFGETIELCRDDLPEDGGGRPVRFRLARARAGRVTSAA